ncbi:hypothetical protein BJX76DRAFT_290699 [Aspergillus varians]
MATESFLNLAYKEPDTAYWESNSRDLSTRWKCDICSAVFQRLDHFKRHTTKHRADKRFICDFCGSLYKRGFVPPAECGSFPVDQTNCYRVLDRDVLRRHWKSCAARIQTAQTIPEPRHGGKEKHACDGCARLKRLCSGEQPCSECYSRGRISSYERLGDRNNKTESPPRKEDASAVSHDTGRIANSEVFDRAQSTWDLGCQNFYASTGDCYTLRPKVCAHPKKSILAMNFKIKNLNEY